MCLEKSERNCLTSYLYNAAILASFFLFLYRHKSEGENVSIKQNSCSSINILHLNILTLDYTNSGCGKREAHNNNWSMAMQRRLPLLELP